MDCVRGEIFLDPNFIYDKQNPKFCDKYLLILNKDHTHLEDVIYIPATTNTREYPYKAGCNVELQVFYFDKDGSFYKAKTVLQLDQIRKHDGEDFDKLVEKGRIERKNIVLPLQEIGQVINCLKKMKEDIPFDIQELIF